MGHPTDVKSECLLYELVFSLEVFTFPFSAIFSPQVPPLDHPGKHQADYRWFVSSDSEPEASFGCFFFSVLPWFPLL